MRFKIFEIFLVCLQMRAQLMAHLVIESHMEKEDREALQGVENCEDKPGPGESLGEIEEAGEPADAEDGEEGGGAFQPGDGLPHHVLLSLGVSGAGVSRHAHGQTKDDAVDCNYSCYRGGKCPNKTIGG